MGDSISSHDLKVGDVMIRRWFKDLHYGYSEDRRAVIQRTSETTLRSLYNDADRESADFALTEGAFGTHQSLVPRELLDGFLMLRAYGRHVAALKLIGVEPRYRNLTALGED